LTTRFSSTIPSCFLPRPRIAWTTLAALVSLLCLSASAGLAATPHSQAKTAFTIAKIHSRGDYGLDADTTLNATVFKLSRRNREGGVSLALPYLSITGPATALYEDIDTGELFLVDIDEHRSGIGDMVMGFDRTVWEERRSSRKISLGASLKLPTGNEEKRLGNGAVDVSIFSNARTRIRQDIISAQLGYQLKGDTDATNYNNRLFASASLYHILDRKWGVGAGIRFKQASLDGYQDQVSANAFVSHGFAAPWAVGLRVNKGFTDSVADFSLAAQLTYHGNYQ